MVSRNCSICLAGHRVFPGVCRWSIILSLPWEWTAWLCPSQRQRGACSPYPSLHLFGDIFPWSRQWPLWPHGCGWEGGGHRTHHAIDQLGPQRTELDILLRFRLCLRWQESWGFLSRARAVGRERVCDISKVVIWNHDFIFENDNKRILPHKASIYCSVLQQIFGFLLCTDYSVLGWPQWTKLSSWSISLSP